MKWNSKVSALAAQKANEIQINKPTEFIEPEDLATQRKKRKHIVENQAGRHYSISLLFHNLQCQQFHS